MKGNELWHVDLRLHFPGALHRRTLNFKEAERLSNYSGHTCGSEVVTVKQKMFT